MCKFTSLFWSNHNYILPSTHTKGCKCISTNDYYLESIQWHNISISDKKNFFKEHRSL